MTPERLSGFRYLANKEGSLFCAAEMREMLAEVDRLTARWEALKEGTSKIRQHWASFHSVAPSAVAEVQTLVARLEAQP